MPTIDDQYVTHCILGKVENEKDRFYYWKQWEACFGVLDELLAVFERKSVWTQFTASLAVPVPPLKSDPPGTNRVTLRALRFGRQKWTYEDNQRRSLLLEEQHEHPVQFDEVRIASSLPKTGAPEVFLRGHMCTILPDGAWNQVLALSVFLGRAQQFGEGVLESSARKLGVIMRSVRIARTIRPWLVSEQRGSELHVDDIPWMRCSGNYKSLELDSRRTWEDLL